MNHPFTTPILSRPASGTRGRPGGALYQAAKLAYLHVARPVGRPRKDAQERPVRLQHIDSGKVVSAPSIADFCRKVKLRGNAKLHITPVLQGARMAYKGWAVPEVINAKLPLKDVWGNTYEETVGELTKHLSTSALRRLRAGQAVGALAPVDHDFGAILPPSRTTKVTSYTFRKPEGSGPGRPTVTAATLLAAAEKLGVSKHSTYLLAHGLTPSAKGATFVGATTEPILRRALSVA